MAPEPPSKSAKFRNYMKTMVTPSAPLISTSMKENAKSAWHAFKLVSKNIEKFLDGTPFKLPFGVLNALIGIADAIIINRESMAILLLPIGQRLEIVSSNLAHKGRPRGIESSCERFSSVLTVAVNELKGLRDEGKLKRLVKCNEHPQQLEDIFRRIDEATKNFELELTLAISREVDGIIQHAEIIRLRDLRPSREARYANVNREGCLEGTRKAIIQDIMAWCTDDSPDCPPVYFLNGMAGTGKSTIAYTVCEKLYDNGDASRRLGASFFCSRQLEGARLRQNVIPTIAYDLAHSFSDFGRALLASKFDAQPPPLKDHIRSLLSTPWRSVTANRGLPPLVVVIDALDELEGKDGSLFLEELIWEIARHQDGFRGLKFFITSRQDPRIIKICASLESRAVCRLEVVPSDIIENDIHLYLCSALPDLEPSTLRILANQAFGLFIYAATAVRFINPPSQLEPPTLRKQEGRLNVQLNAWPNRAQRGVDGLLVDRLYEDILSTWLSPKADVDRKVALSVLQTVICTEEPILITDIPQFMESEFDVEQEEVLNLILSLHAVLYIADNRAYSYHKSFLDFTCDTTRFEKQELAALLCPTPERQLCLATSCFRVMHSLQFNMCDLPSSYLNDSQVADLPARIDKNISYALRYACRHWAKHMSKAPSEKRAMKITMTIYQQWMEHQLLFWMEAMSLLKVTRECYPLLIVAREWIGTNITFEEKQDLLAAENLAASLGNRTISASTPHLYISGLATCTWESSLMAKWRVRFPRIPRVMAFLNEDLPMSTLRLPPHYRMLSATYSPAWTNIVAGTINGTLIWDIYTGELLEMETDNMQDPVRSVCFSPDGKYVASSHRECVSIWEVSTRKELNRLVGPGDVGSVLFSPHGTHIVTVHWGSAHLWETSTWKELYWFGGGYVLSLICFSPDGTKIAWNSMYGTTVYISDVFNNNEPRLLDARCGEVISFCFSPDGPRIVSSSKNTIHIWDTSNGNELHRLNAHYAEFTSVCFSPDGTKLASGSETIVHIWDSSNGNELHSLHRLGESEGDCHNVTSVCFSPDGTRIASSFDKTVQIWDVLSGKKLNQLVEQDSVTSIRFSPDGARISATHKQGLSIWYIPAMKDRQWYLLEGHSASVHSTHFSPDGTQIVSLSADDTVRLWDISTRKELHQQKIGVLGDWVDEANFSTDGSKIVVHPTSGSNYDRCWDAVSWEPLHDQSPVETVDCKIFGTLRVEQYQHTVRIWDTLTETAIEIDGHPDGRKRKSVCFAPDGTRLVTGEKDTTVRIWDTKTGKELNRLEGHSGEVNSVCFSPNGKQIVSGSNDMTVRIWDVPGTQVCQRRGNNHLVGFLPDGVPAHSESCPPYHSYASTWIFPELGTLRTDWRINSDGWITSSDGKRYFWLSKKMQTYLKRPDTTVISSLGSVEVDFSAGRYGRGWADCYEPM